jgi:hypothetical protein
MSPDLAIAGNRRGAAFDAAGFGSGLDIAIVQARGDAPPPWFYVGHFPEALSQSNRLLCGVWLICVKPRARQSVNVRGLRIADPPHEG